MIYTNNILVLRLEKNVTNHPVPASITSLWNFGFMLRFCLVTQILTGIFLAIKLKIFGDESFKVIIELTKNPYPATLRYVHANGASLFFVCIYIHIARGMYYRSYKKTHTWLSGVTILFITMATAFLGYVLPWGQISFWGASVIIGLLSAIPLIGDSVAAWLWRGFSITDSTLARFFTLHFLLPFILTAIILIHIVILHQVGSSRPLGVSSTTKVSFKQKRLKKDILVATLLRAGLMCVALTHSDLLGDVENFISADRQTTPLHIIPEWYYLFAYAILRAIPNKLGGVLALFARIAILYLLPLSPRRTKTSFSPSKKIMFWLFTTIFLALTWIGANPVEEPYTLVGQILTSFYFFYFLFWFFYYKSRLL